MTRHWRFQPGHTDSNHRAFILLIQTHGPVQHANESTYESESSTWLYLVLRIPCGQNRRCRDCQWIKQINRINHKELARYLHWTTADNTEINRKFSWPNCWTFWSYLKQRGRLSIAARDGNQSNHQQSNSMCFFHLKSRSCLWLLPMCKPSWF